MNSPSENQADIDDETLASLSYRDLVYEQTVFDPSLRCQAQRLHWERKIALTSLTVPDTIIKPFPKHVSRVDLGVFDRLCLELLRSILSLLTYTEINSFGSVNSRARDYVVTMPMFQGTYAPDCRPRVVFCNLSPVLRITCSRNMSRLNAYTRLEMLTFR